MKIIKTRKELSEFRGALNLGAKIGFVPTMGALHEGHLSLVRQAKKENNVVVVSIFVNPTQFNNKEDLDKYPRMPEDDMALLEKEKVDVAFLPEVEEMYPVPDTRQFDFSPLDTVMEGRFRPGHFNGVGQVVSKLFDFVKPHNAYFGQKDFQQLAIIQKLVKDYNFSVNIVGVPIVREKDGLALSSRNLRLTPEQRQAAPLIYKTLTQSLKQKENYSVEETKEFVIQTINSNPLLEVEYFEIVDSETLQEIQNWGQCSSPVGCIAVFAGKIRLIDNLIYSTD